MNQRSIATRLLTAFVLLATGGSGTRAVAQENTDPSNTQAQFGHGANVGWLNAEPSGDGGPGVTVSDGSLTGYVWGSNIGWISLSCENAPSSCATVSYGVQNDGNGGLSGFAYGQNVGWIDFRPAIGGTPVSGAGVLIDPGTGLFSGKAYAANLGWVHFGTFVDPSAAAAQAQTSWRAATPTITPGGPTLTPTPTITPGGPTLTPTRTITPGGPTLTPTPQAVPLAPPSGTDGTLLLLSLAGILAAAMRAKRDPEL